MDFRDGVPQNTQDESSIDMRALNQSNHSPFLCRNPIQESASMYNSTHPHYPTQVSPCEDDAVQMNPIVYGKHMCPTATSMWSTVYQNVTLYNNEVGQQDKDISHYDIGQPAGYAVLLGNDRKDQIDPGPLPLMKDFHLMSDVLHDCGWYVQPIPEYPGMSLKECDTKLNSVYVDDFDQYSCFMFYYSGHGNSEGLLLSDGCCKPYVDIVQSVSSINSLTGKPKIFIFDSCRCKKEKSRWNFFRDINKIHSENLTENYPPPDTLICYSASEGMEGYSHDDNGSFYTSQLADKLRQFWNRLTFTEIVTLVHGWTVHLAQQEKKQQQPVMYNSLNRLLLFGARDIFQSIEKLPTQESIHMCTGSSIIKEKGLNRPNARRSDGTTDAARKGQLLSVQFKTKQDVTNNLPRLGQGVSVFVCYAPDPESPYYDPKERKDEIVHNQIQITHLIRDLERVGFSVISDLHLGNSQPRNWLQWYVSRIELCDYLIMVCSPAFKELFSCDKPKCPITDERTSWFLTYRDAMYAEISAEVKNSPSGSKFVPVLIDNSFVPQDCVPTLLLTATKYQLDQKAPREFKYDTMYGEFERLVCRMAGIDRIKLDAPIDQGRHQLAAPYSHGTRPVKNIQRKRPKGHKVVPWVPATEQQPQSHAPPAKRVVSPENPHVAPLSQFPHCPPPSQPDQLPNKPPEPSVILWLCGKITDWRFVARFLKMDNSEIERIGIDHRDGGVVEQRYQMFESWKRHECREYNYRTLGDVLLQTESNRHLYSEFCRKVNELN